MNELDIDLLNQRNLLSNNSSVELRFSSNHFSKCRSLIFDRFTDCRLMAGWLSMRVVLVFFTLILYRFRTWTSDEVKIRIESIPRQNLREMILADRPEYRNSNHVENVCDCLSNRWRNYRINFHEIHGGLKFNPLTETETVYLLSYVMIYACRNKFVPLTFPPNFMIMWFILFENASLVDT